MSDYRVIIRKGDIFVRRWNPETRSHEEKLKERQGLSDVLQFRIEIEDTTFGQFFDIIAREGRYYEHIFESAMYGHPLPPYAEEIKKPSDPTKYRELDHVEVYWHVDFWGEEIEIGAGFHGWGNWGKPYEDAVVGVDYPEKGGIALEFSPLHEYKDHPFKLDTKFEIWDMSDPKKKEPILKGKREFTAYDVIDAILYEITWSGDISKGRNGPGGER